MQGAYYMQGAVNGYISGNTQMHLASPAHLISPVHGMHGVPASPVVDCWGLSNWLPTFGTAHMQSVSHQAPPLHAALVAYDALIKGELAELLKSCDKIGEPVADYGLALAAAFRAQRDMIAKALSKRRLHTDDTQMAKLLAPTDAALTQLEVLKSRSCDTHPEKRNHLQMLCGASSALGWITTADPKAYVSDALNAVPVFARKIQESECAESKQLVLGEELIRNLKTLLRALKVYVEKHHHSGLTWMPEGSKVARAEAAAAPAISTDTEKMGYAGAAMISDYDSILRDKVVPVVETCYLIGDDDVIATADCMQRAFKAQRDMLVLASKHSQPSVEVTAKVLEETSEVLSELAELEDECEGKECAHVIKLLVNGMSALAWVSVEHPVVFVSEVVNSLPVFSDKIENLAKRRSGEGVGGETSAEVELVKRFKEVIRSILQYVKARHAQGISWNPGGSVLKSFP